MHRRTVERCAHSNDNSVILWIPSIRFCVYYFGMVVYLFFFCYALLCLFFTGACVCLYVLWVERKRWYAQLETLHAGRTVQISNEREQRSDGFQLFLHAQGNIGTTLMFMSRRRRKKSTEKFYNTVYLLVFQMVQTCTAPMNKQWETKLLKTDVWHNVIRTLNTNSKRHIWLYA